MPENEPTPDLLDEIPDAPDWFTPQHFEIWGKLVPLLINSKLLTGIDVQALARYVDTLVDWKEAKKFLDKHGSSYPIYENKKIRNPATKKYENKEVVKYMAQFPQVAIKRACAAELLRLEREFGMTPSSRAGLGVGEGGGNGKKTDKDPFAI